MAPKNANACGASSKISPGPSSGASGEHLVRALRALDVSGNASSSGVAFGSVVDAKADARVDAANCGNEAQAWNDGALEVEPEQDAQDPWIAYEPDGGADAQARPQPHSWRGNGRRCQKPGPCKFGDFYRTPGKASGIQCRGYSWPAEWNGNGPIIHRFAPGSCLGPAQRFYECDRFRAALVPVWDAKPGGGWTKRLVWVNVYCYQNNVKYAYRVPDDEVQSWMRDNGYEIWHPPHWLVEQRSPPGAFW